MPARGRRSFWNPPPPPSPLRPPGRRGSRGGTHLSLYGNADRRAFRDVAGARLDMADRVEAEPVAEPVEQRRQIRSGLRGSPRPPAARASLPRLRGGVGEEAGQLVGRQGLDLEDGEDHVLGAEAGTRPDINYVEVRGHDP